MAEVFKVKDSGPPFQHNIVFNWPCSVKHNTARYLLYRYLVVVFTVLPLQNHDNIILVITFAISSDTSDTVDISSITHLQYISR